MYKKDCVIIKSLIIALIFMFVMSLNVIAAPNITVTCIGCSSTSSFFPHPTNTQYPTCIQDGFIITNCYKCGKQISKEILPALGHHITDWTTYYAPTCIQYGLEIKYCTRCGLVTEERIMDLSKSHRYVWIIDKEPTCTAFGYKHEECSLCGEEKSSYEAIKKLNHEYVWVIDKWPTSTETGLKYRECKLCGNIQNEGTIIEVYVGILGDATDDGVVDTSDAQAVFNHFMGTRLIENEKLYLNGDVTSDKILDTSDAQMLFNMFMGNI